MRLFVTGTDTEVGKTVVTACLARAARARGSVIASKPVASGVAPGTPGEDAETIAAAAGHAPHTFATFVTPVSPHRAARLEGRALPPNLLESVAALHADTVIVEGVGGFRVPLSLDPDLWVADLCHAARPDVVVVVAADRLGVLNHTLLTLDAVRAAGPWPCVVALNRHGLDATDVSTASNLEDLRVLCDCEVVPVPALESGDTDAQATAGAALWRAIVRHAPNPR